MATNSIELSAIGVFGMDTRGHVEFSGLTRQVSEVRLLAGGKPLKYRQAGAVLTVEVPAQPPDPHVSVLAIETR